MNPRKLGEPAPNLVFTRWLYLRALALVSLAAFGSLYVQLPGLIGSRGLLPAASAFDVPGPSLGTVFRLPTLAWWVSSDAGLAGMSLVGAGLSLLLLLNVAPRLVLLGAWGLHLSLIVAGGPFFRYQWDLLLTETLFMSVFVAPPHWLPGGEVRSPSRASVLAIRGVLFKFMMLAGAAKLLSGDPAWWGLEATVHHFETQPLPNPVAWYADGLPAAVHAGLALGVLVIELAVPLLIFGPRRMRLAAFYPLVGLQGAIVLTGNYGALNLLSVVLCVMLLDDEHLRGFRLRIPCPLYPRAGPGEAAWMRRGCHVVLGGLLVLNLVVVSHWLLRPVVPGWVGTVRRAVGPWRTVNVYGLFGVMTTTRREVIVQGSRDGRDWKPYVFRHKPGDPERRPSWVVGHMPRLDWQMWFLALRDSDGRTPRWFRRLAVALLENRRPVLDLLAHNPFGDRPPRYVRAVTYRYRFAPSGGAASRWWVRDRRRLHLAPVSLRDGRLEPAAGRRPAGDAGSLNPR